MINSEKGECRWIGSWYDSADPDFFFLDVLIIDKRRIGGRGPPGPAAFGLIDVGNFIEPPLEEGDFQINVEKSRRVSSLNARPAEAPECPQSRRDADLFEKSQDHVNGDRDGYIRLSEIIPLRLGFSAATAQRRSGCATFDSQVADRCTKRREYCATIDHCLTSNDHQLLITVPTENPYITLKLQIYSTQNFSDFLKEGTGEFSDRWKIVDE